jgi:hypothetical protein
MTTVLSGKLTLELQSGQTLDSFCKRFIPNYDTDRFEAIALRFFAGKEFIATVFAHDKLSPKNEAGLMPVKKFKLEKLSIHQLQEFILSFNFTLAEKDVNIDEMEVINK